MQIETDVHETTTHDLVLRDMPVSVAKHLLTALHSYVSAGALLPISQALEADGVDPYTPASGKIRDIEDLAARLHYTQYAKKRRLSKVPWDVLDTASKKRHRQRAMEILDIPPIKTGVASTAPDDTDDPDSFFELPGSGETCDLCGRDYEVNYMVPDDVWKLVAPKDIGKYSEHLFGGLLCPDCAARKAKEHGIDLVFEGKRSWEENDLSTPGPFRTVVQQRPDYLAALLDDHDRKAFAQVLLDTPEYVRPRKDKAPAPKRTKDKAARTEDEYDDNVVALAKATFAVEEAPLVARWDKLGILVREDRLNTARWVADNLKDNGYLLAPKDTVNPKPDLNRMAEEIYVLEMETEGVAFQDFDNLDAPDRMPYYDRANRLWEAATGMKS